MTTPSDDSLPPELEEIGDLLREHRPRASALELDRWKLGVRSRSGRTSAATHQGRGTLVTSRIFITLLLALGALGSASGAALAIAPSVVGSSDISAAQYDDIGVSPGDESGGNDPGQLTVKGESAKSGTESSKVSSSTAQGPRQTAASSDSSGGKLPFTGFAAIPLMLAGAALLASGLVLRRRVS